MKKNLLTVAIAALALASCSGNSGKADNADNTSEATENTAKELLSTPDLTFAEARGNVKSITLKTVDGKMQGNEIVPDASQGNTETLTIYNFDEQGRLTGYREVYKNNGQSSEFLAYTVDYSADPKGKVKNSSADKYTKSMSMSLVRDDNGQITNYEFGVDNDFDGCRSLTYTWADGQITSEEFTGWEWSGSIDHKYDDKGNLIEDTTASSDYDGTVKSTSTYKYNATDDAGNWTSRTRTSVENSVEYEGVVTKSNNAKPSYTIQTREIEYYPAK